MKLNTQISELSKFFFQNADNKVPERDYTWRDYYIGSVTPENESIRLKNSSDALCDETSWQEYLSSNLNWGNDVSVFSLINFTGHIVCFGNNLRNQYFGFSVQV